MDNSLKNCAFYIEAFVQFCKEWSINPDSEEHGKPQQFLPGSRLATDCFLSLWYTICIFDNELYTGQNTFVMLQYNYIIKFYCPPVKYLLAEHKFSTLYTMSNIHAKNRCIFRNHKKKTLHRSHGPHTFTSYDPYDMGSWHIWASLAAVSQITSRQISPKNTPWVFVGDSLSAFPRCNAVLIFFVSNMCNVQIGIDVYINLKLIALTALGYVS